MLRATPVLIPAPRPVPEQPQAVPLRLPWSRTQTTCRPVIGDALLLQYPEVAEALAGIIAEAAPAAEEGAAK